MADRRYRPVNFGFLNTAQDSTDIGEFESPNATNLDPDELSLGALKHQQYSGLGTKKDFQETTFSGRRFFLGSYDPYTSYFTGFGYHRSSDKAISLPDTADYVIAFDVFFSSLTDGYLFGNFDTGTPERGLGYFRLNGGAFQYRRNDPLGTWSDFNIGTPTFSQWYRVVLRFTESDFRLQVFLDGAFVVEGFGTSATTDTSGPLYIGGSPSNGSANFRLRNLAIVQGRFESPAEWDGSLISSLSPETRYKIDFASANGSGFDNQQGFDVQLSGTSVPITGTQTKAEGPINAELSTDAETTTVPAKAWYYHKSPIAYGAQVDVNLNIGTALLVAFDLQTSYFSTTGTYDQTIFQFGTTGGTPVGLEIRFDNGVVKYRVEDGGGFSSLQTVLSAREAIYTKRLAFVIYDRTAFENRYIANVYADGELVSELSSTTAYTILSSANKPSFSGYSYAATGTFTTSYYVENFYIANISDPSDLSFVVKWDGSRSQLNAKGSVLLGAANGNLSENEEGYTTSVPTGMSGLPSTLGPTVLTFSRPVSPVASDTAPRIPDAPTIAPKEDLSIDSDVLAVAPLTTDAIEIGVKEGLTYSGPEESTIILRDFTYTPAATVSRSFFRVRFKGDGAKEFREFQGLADQEVISLPYNLEVRCDPSAASFSHTGVEYTIQIKAPSLLDGKYQYRTVAVRKTNTDPKIEIESRPSPIVDFNLNNIDAAGTRRASNVPVVTIPGIAPGYPNYIDRIDLYRKDPDSEEFVKVSETSSLAAGEFPDTKLITELPRIEFLKTADDESFEVINDAIGNTSGNYYMLFNKDNRLWTVPSDRKDLLLYSRENDWWGWRRENSFSFNGDIVDVVAIRDLQVVNGESTLVVFTTKGIYHVVGSGVESSPYVRVPMFGGDGQSEIDCYAGSALPFNGSIFFLAKSSDGGYETGSYGQKIYEYNLQQLVELSGRIKKTGTLDGDSNEIEFASLLAGDKYVLKKLTNDTCLVYHKDARGWLTYSATASQDWVWESKLFDRQSRLRGSVADARTVKINYKGDVRLTFTIYDGQGNSNAKTVDLSSVTRTTWENVMPANMGIQWSFKLESNSDTTAEVYNMWFV